MSSNSNNGECLLLNIKNNVWHLMMCVRDYCMTRIIQYPKNPQAHLTDSLLSKRMSSRTNTCYNFRNIKPMPQHDKKQEMGTMIE